MKHQVGSSLGSGKISVELGMRQVPHCNFIFPVHLFWQRLGKITCMVRITEVSSRPESSLQGENKPWPLSSLNKVWIKCLNQGQLPGSKHTFLEEILSQQPSSMHLGICVTTNTARERALTCYVVAWSTQFSSHLKENTRCNNEGKAAIRAIFPSTLLSKGRLVKRLQWSTDPESPSQASNLPRRDVSLPHQFYPIFLLRLAQLFTLHHPL